MELVVVAGAEEQVKAKSTRQRSSAKAPRSKATKPAAGTKALRPARAQIHTPKEPRRPLPTSDDHRLQRFRGKRRDIVMLLILAAGFLWTVASRVPSAIGASLSSSPSPREGFLAPAFTLDTLGGGTVALPDLRGKVVVVNFWASWCFPCRQETPALQAVYEQYKDSGVVVVGVNLTNQDSMADLRTFAHEFGLTYPILLDRDGSVGLQYRVQGLPSTFFVSRKGVIRTVVVGGPMSDTFIRSKVEALLAEGE
jgi:cytochrome c biogenesis protein CcmG/thiol:disulfide interchange protein DsbE